jgi:hypothetical protein
LEQLQKGGRHVVELRASALSSAAVETFAALGDKHGAKVEIRKEPWAAKAPGELRLRAVGSSRQSSAFVDELVQHPTFRKAIEKQSRIAGWIPSTLAPMSKEYAAWATSNVRNFKDGTYFAVSYNTRTGVAKLFPGLGSKFRDEIGRAHV